MTFNESIPGPSRRGFLGTSLMGFTALSLSGATAKDFEDLPGTFAYDDAGANVAAMARLAGDLKPGGGVGRVRYHGRSFAYRPGQPILPLYGVEGLGSTRTIPMDDGSIRFLFSEFAVFTDLKTGAPLERWTNPMSEAEQPVFHQRNGPVNFALSPGFNMFGAFDAVDEGDGFQLPWDSVAGFAAFALDVTSNRKNPLDKAEWPAESTGPVMNISEHSQYFVDPAKLADERVTNLPFHATLQSLKPFHPFMRMGETSGTVFTRLNAAKVQGMDALSPPVAVYARANLAEYVDPPAEWTGQYTTSHTIFKNENEPYEDAQ